MPFPGYSGWVLQIDPTAVAIDRSMLDINNPTTGIQIGGTSSGQGIDWGQSIFTQMMAQEGEWGSAPADFIVPNRTVTIPLGLGMGGPGSPTAVMALASLREKVGLLQREGGWLLRQRLGGPNLYADIVDAQLTAPDVWTETAEIEPNVTLTLVCAPDFYGDEIPLDSQSATGVFTSVLTLSGSAANISGDYPARTRIIVTDTSGNNQLASLWGDRVRYYSASSTAALFYEAEALTPTNSAAVTGLGGASGGSVVSFTCPTGANGVWINVLSTNLLSGSAPLTHLGTYEVWTRVYSPNATPQLRLQWGAGSLAVPATNTAVVLPGQSNFYLVDLGTISIPQAPVGSTEWFGYVETLMTNVGDTLDIDCLYLQPLAEKAGKLVYQYLPSGISAPANAGTGADNNGTGSLAWSNPGNITSAGLSATAGTSGSGVFTHYLEATNLGFAVPSIATILGILVTYNRQYSTAGSGAMADHTVSLMKTGALVGNNLSGGALWSTSPAIVQFGSASNLWGTTWAPADVNNSGFGVALNAQIVGLGSLTTAIVNAPVTITVYYQLAAGGAVTQDAVIYASETAEIRWDQIVRINSSGTVYGPVSKVTGDLARLPPSGLEGRPAQVFVKPTRGDLNTLPDAGLDTFTVQVKYRPCYLDLI